MKHKSKLLQMYGAPGKVDPFQDLDFGTQFASELRALIEDTAERNLMSFVESRQRCALRLQVSDKTLCRWLDETVRPSRYERAGALAILAGYWAVAFT